MRFRRRPVSESRVEADGEGTMTPVAPDVDDCCCCTEDDDWPKVDDVDDNRAIVVGRFTGEG